MAAIYKSKFLLIVFLLIVNLGGLNLPLRAQSQEGSPRLMQGPMVGAVSENEIQIWVRTSGALTVAIEYGTDDQLKTAQETEPVLTTKSNDYTGVVLLSGDTHVGELNVIPWSEKGGYDFYDLVSSPLAQPPTDSWLERHPERRIRPVYFSGPNFGVIDFSFGDSTELIFRLIDSEGRSVWAPFELQAEELVNGVASWQTKVDSRENQRHENYDRGKGYYKRRP